MRKILLVGILLTIGYTAHSQMSGEYNYSLALRAYTVMQMPKIVDEANSRYFTNAPINGVFVKFNNNQIGYRFGGTYYNRSKNFFNNCETCEEANGKLVDYSFKLGFEKNFNYAYVQPYIALDVGFRSNEFNGDLENRNDLKAQASKTPIASSVKLEASKVGFVVAPTFGIRINPLKYISFFAEGSLDFFYSYERQETVARDVANTRTFKKFNKTEYLLNPFSIGIQVHLNRNK